jgi:hypothetical protein
VQGARAVQRSILEGYPDADITVGIVWINMLEDDTEMTARRAAQRTVTDFRVRHFYDPQKRAGKAIARTLGGEGKVAWDIYLFYEKGAEWVEGPPTPSDWMHQLTASSWASLAHYHSGDDLVAELHKTMKKRFDA